MNEDFNRIEPWLKAKLAERDITTHTFARLMKTTSATVYRWYSDKYRPTPEMMKRAGMPSLGAEYAFGDTLEPVNMGR